MMMSKKKLAVLACLCFTMLMVVGCGPEPTLTLSGTDSALVGTWKGAPATSIPVFKQTSTDMPTLPEITATFTADGKFTVKPASDTAPVTIKGIYAVNKDTDPRQADFGITKVKVDVPLIGCIAGCAMDLIPGLKDIPGTTFKGIYQFDKDGKLVMCLSMAVSADLEVTPGERPVSFTDAVTKLLPIYVLSKQ